MTKVFKTTGFDELERALVDELPKATAKNILKRAALAAMKPVVERAQQLVPVDKGNLRDSIKAQALTAKRVSRTRFEASKGVTVAVSPTGFKQDGFYARFQEFGTVKQAANPYMRPAWDSEEGPTLDRIKSEIAVQIGKARVRIARKLARGK